MDEGKAAKDELSRHNYVHGHMTSMQALIPINSTGAVATQSRYVGMAEPLYFDLSP